MANRGYSWKNVRQGSTFSLPRTEHVGRLVTVAVVLALVAHVAVIFGLKNMSVTFPAIRQMLNIETEPIVVREVEFRESLPELKQEELAEPPEVAGELLDEIEILEEIPEDTELDMSPEISDPQFDVEMVTPAMKGEALAESLEPIAGPELTHDLPEIGRMDDVLQVAAAGQLVIDPGEQKADTFDPDKFNEELERKGAGGLADDGALENFTPLAAMARMDGNALQNTKGMIGSDLLFEFNKATLRESARNSLLKVALLIDKNPKLNCWIEGHTDTIGGDTPNGELSLERARAVKQWLVEAMRIDPERLIVIGYGKRQPIVLEGDKDTQAINRRVVIKMRKGKPVKDSQMFLENALPPEPVKPKVGEAVLVKPSGPPIIPSAQRVDEEPPARAVIEEPSRRALPVEEQRRRAIPVTPGRAVPAE
ncbi:OmpA family protein [Rubritalea tangerina]|uniref:OmpA family protein n=2 Tax=Rubritalea tangerina TaxID=430798 RepID=A0ABW4ZDN8_9BACT